MGSIRCEPEEHEHVQGGMGKDLTGRTTHNRPFFMNR